MPSGGVRGVPGIVSIVGGKSGELPLVILDADGSGKSSKTKLQSGLYQHQKDAIIDAGQFLNLENSEVEDLLPPQLMFRPIERFFRDVEDEIFEDIFEEGQATIPQIEKFAERHTIYIG